MQYDYYLDGYHQLISRLTGHKIKNTADIRKLSCIPNELKRRIYLGLMILRNKTMVKYKTKTYTKHHAWTSYNNLDYSQAKAIQDSCYDEIPETIETELGDIELFNDIDGFVPINEAYENPGKVWSHNKRSDWYTHVVTGVKVKKEVVKSPNYDKPNGNGTRTTTLTVKIPLASERGKNPNSHHNKPKMPDRVTKDINLTPEQWEQIEALGKGKGYSQGIRNLLADLDTLQASFETDIYTMLNIDLGIPKCELDNLTHSEESQLLTQECRKLRSS